MRKSEERKEDPSTDGPALTSALPEYYLQSRISEASDVESESWELVWERVEGVSGHANYEDKQKRQR